MLTYLLHDPVKGAALQTGYVFTGDNRCCNASSRCARTCSAQLDHVFGICASNLPSPREQTEMCKCECGTRPGEIHAKCWSEGISTVQLPAYLCVSQPHGGPVVSLRRSYRQEIRFAIDFVVRSLYFCISCIFGGYRYPRCVYGPLSYSFILPSPSTIYARTSPSTIYARIVTTG